MYLIPVSNDLSESFKILVEIFSHITNLRLLLINEVFLLSIKTNKSQPFPQVALQLFTRHKEFHLTYMIFLSPQQPME